MLYHPERHEALAAPPWDDTLALQAVREIASALVAARDARGRWPLHPKDDEGDNPVDGFKSLYLGRAGVLWALWTLREQGAIDDLPFDPAEAIVQVEADFQAVPDIRADVGGVPSYFLGEAGIQLVRWRLTGAAEAADRLFDVVQANIGHPSNEALWAAPGTMVAAWHLWTATGEARWRQLYLDNVEQVWRTWLFDEPTGTWLWTQLLGGVVQYIGAGHGFAGNAYALLIGQDLLDAPRRSTLLERTAGMLKHFARRDGHAANWPPATAEPRPGRPQVLLQWCHGAPGIVTALAAYPVGHDTEVDALLVGGGEATWRAGPLTKGPGLCHGTAGNGYAFLKLHRRTGDAVWLDRARAFAMHALQQRAQQRAEYGMDRCTLWTGDAGLAMFVWDCLQGRDALPALDRI